MPVQIARFSMRGERRADLGQVGCIGRSGLMFGGGTPGIEMFDEASPLS
jgi:hypothetical protein